MPKKSNVIELEPLVFEFDKFLVKNKITNTAAGKALNVNYNSIWSWRSGRVTPTPKNQANIRKYISNEIIRQGRGRKVRTGTPTNPKKSNSSNIDRNTLIICNNDSRTTILSSGFISIKVEPL